MIPGGSKVSLAIQSWRYHLQRGRESLISLHGSCLYMSVLHEHAWQHSAPDIHAYTRMNQQTELACSFWYRIIIWRRHYHVCFISTFKCQWTVSIPTTRYASLDPKTRVSDLVKCWHKTLTPRAGIHVSWDAHKSPPLHKKAFKTRVSGMKTDCRIQATVSRNSNWSS